METPTLDKAVTEAVEQTPPTEQIELDKPVEKEEPSEEEPTEDEDAESEEDVSEPEEEDGLSAQDITNARALFKALKDPASAKSIITALAQQVGVLHTQQDVQQAKDAVLEVLQDSLGTEFNFLAPKLSIAIKRILEMERRGYQQALQQESQQRIQLQLASEIETTLGRLRRETKGESKHLEGRMTELMDELPIGKGISTEKYLRHLYKVANAEAISKSTKRSLAAKINQNANDVGSRLASGGAKGSGVQGKPIDGKMTLDQSIQFALESIGVKG